jgi:hypothetical protein
LVGTYQLQAAIAAVHDEAAVAQYRVAAARTTNIPERDYLLSKAPG